MPYQFIDKDRLDLDDPKYEKYNPVLAHIYNTGVNQSGQPFTICRRHYTELEARLAQKALNVS